MVIFTPPLEIIPSYYFWLLSMNCAFFSYIISTKFLMKYSSVLFDCTQWVFRSDILSSVWFNDSFVQLIFKLFNIYHHWYHSVLITFTMTSIEGGTFMTLIIWIIKTIALYSHRAEDTNSIRLNTLCSCC